MVEWDIRFLELARFVSGWSKDNSTKVGAVIANPTTKEVISLGYNGFPRGIEDKQEYLNNREEKYKRVLHAEQNALIFSGSSDLSECSIYIYPYAPCNRCALEIIQRGLKRVVCVNTEPLEHWEDSLDLAENLFIEAYVDVVYYPFERLR